MPQEQSVETLASTRVRDDRLNLLLFVSALCCLSLVGAACLVTNIFELIQILAADAGVRRI